VKFSARLSDNSIQFQWTGDYPTQWQVEETLLETGCAKINHDYAWRTLRTCQDHFLSFYTRRPALAWEMAARQAKSRIAKELRCKFPETKFRLSASYKYSFDPNLSIEWLNGPQEDEVSAIAHSLSDGVRFWTTREEPCDLCGARTIASLRGKTCEDEPTDCLLVCLDCQFFGRWHRFKQKAAAE
jgi:hypothetical protein